MHSLLLASTAALLAAPAIAQIGSAIVRNECAEAVNVHNVPGPVSGMTLDHDAETRVLQPGDVYQQQYTPLNTKQGWAIKLFKDGGEKHPMQFEYTYGSDEPRVHYDISAVDGFPWNANWWLETQGGHDPSDPSAPCRTTQQYYRCPEDDSNGMQPDCSSDATIVLHLCAAQSKNQTVLDGLRRVAAAAPPPPCVPQNLPVIGSDASSGAGDSSSSSSTAAAAAQATAAPAKIDTNNNVVKAANVQPVAAQPAAASTPSNTPAAAAKPTPPPVAPPAQQNKAVVDNKPTTLVTSRTAHVMFNDNHIHTEVVTFTEVATEHVTHTVQARHVHQARHEH